jgi:hypothetical protein
MLGGAKLPEAGGEIKLRCGCDLRHPARAGRSARDHVVDAADPLYVMKHCSGLERDRATQLDALAGCVHMAAKPYGDERIHRAECVVRDDQA